MSPTTTNEKMAAAAAVAQVRARELAARAGPAAAQLNAQMKPLARSTQEAALRYLYATRVWAADDNMSATLGATLSCRTWPLCSMRGAAQTRVAYR